MTPENRQRMQVFIGTLDGIYHIDIHPQRDTRSLRQNAYYWSCLVKPYFDWLREQGSEDIVTEEDAHEDMRKKLLGDKPVFSKKTGAIITHHRVSTTELSKPEMSRYIDGFRDYLAKYCDYIAPDPNPYFRDEPAKRTA